MSEYLPAIEVINGAAVVAGRVERTEAHILRPALHPTALIVPVTPAGSFVLADKAPKDKLKAKLRGNPPPPIGVSLDCFGGHMEYAAVSEAERQSGISAKTWLSCAIRELGEEFYIDEKSIVPDASRFELIGFFMSDDPTNLEYSAAYYYRLPVESGFTARDNVGSLEVDMPVYIMTPSELASCGFKLAEGLSRILSTICK